MTQEYKALKEYILGLFWFLVAILSHESSWAKWAALGLGILNLIIVHIREKGMKRD